MDDIRKDEDTEVRLATDEEIRALIDALEKRKVSYKYDEDTKTIRIYEVYPTLWMKVKKWFCRLFNK